MSQLFDKSPNDYLYYSPSYDEPNSYTAVLNDLDESSETALGTSSRLTQSTILRKKLAIEEVYVIKTDGEESLVYDSNMMKKGKKYPVVWNDEHFVLIKSDSDVSIYKFHPEQ